MVLFTNSNDWDTFTSRLNVLQKLETGPYFQYYEVEGGVIGFDSTEDVTADFEAEELSHIEGIIGSFRAALVEYENTACRDAFLRCVAPGLKGVLDTNYEEIVPYAEILRWISSHPGTHFREYSK